MSYGLLVVIFTLLMLPGLIGVIAPVLPGIPYMFVVALILAYWEHFTRITPLELSILGIITVISLLVDYFSGVLGAKFGGASPGALKAGIIGLLVGLVLLPPLGSIIGLFLGVLGYELFDHHSKEKAIKAATGSLLGAVAGIGINVVLAVLFLILFLFFAF